MLPRSPVPARAARRPTLRPLRIAELTADPRLRLPARPTDGVPDLDGGLLLPIGPGGDEGRPLTLDLLRTGGLLVTGSSGSGRTTALTAFGQHVSALGAAVLCIGRPPVGGNPAEDIPGAIRVDAADEAGATEWLGTLGGRPGVVIADDVGAPGDIPALARIHLNGARGRLALIAAAHAGQLTAHYQGPVAVLRRGRTGLLLCPGPGDADLLGIRLPRTPLPHRPGSGWLVTGAAVHRVQVARRDPAVVPDPREADAQSRSSAGPISWLAYQASS
jgi:S-DNA-T family DNA segregation ATPase FtsK/SpoIIIE